MNIKNIGKTIAVLRKNNNLSQQELAQMVNVSNKTISKWECGNSLPDIEALDKIATVFKMTIDELINYDFKIPQSEESAIPNNVDTQAQVKRMQKNKFISLITVLISFVLLIAATLCFFLVPRKAQILGSDIFDINDDSKLSCIVSNSTEIFSFKDSIEVPFNVNWGVYRDLMSVNPINADEVKLKEGDNKFYIIVENSIGDKKTYDAVIRRKPLYEVYIDDKIKFIEEGEIINEPLHPHKSGYEFVGWNREFPIVVTQNMKIYAVWKERTDVPYRVEYYLQNIENDQYTLYSVDNLLVGKTGETVSAKVNGFANFTYNYIKSESRGEIKADGSLVLKLYYDRDKITISKTYGGIIDGSKSTYKCGENVSLTAIPYLGYEFIGWYSGDVLKSKQLTYDFIAQKDVEARFQCKAELNAFSISSTVDTCEIKGVKNKAILEAEIPNYVTNIGANAFKGCNQLQSIRIPNSVTTVAREAFYGCSNLQSIYIESLEGWMSIDFEDIYSSPIQKNSFLYIDNQAVTSIKIPEGIKEIKDYTFYRYENLKNVEFAESIEKIGAYSFCVCKGLESIDLPDNVVSIGFYAFSGCSGIKEIQLPDSITSVGNYAFNLCVELESVYLSKNLSSISMCMFYGCTSLKSITIPNGVKNIGEKAFYNCTSLGSVEFSNSIEEVYYAAFYGCNAIKNVYFKGDKSDWNAITFGASSSYLTSKTRYYYSQNEPSDDGLKYYHYDLEGNVVVW